MSDVVVQQVVAKARFRNETIKGSLTRQTLHNCVALSFLKGNRISQQPFMREKEATNGYASNSPEMILSTTSA
jgi:hypothetical protein